MNVGLRSNVRPHLSRGLDHQFQLAPLLVFSQQIAFHPACKSVLRAERELIHRKCLLVRGTKRSGSKVPARSDPHSNRNASQKRIHVELIKQLFGDRTVAAVRVPGREIFEKVIAEARERPRESPTRETEIKDLSAIPPITVQENPL